MNRWVSVAAIGVTLGALAVADARQLPTELPSTKFVSGQNVVPYFEGWIRNADGTFDLVFGYFNRNWQEEPAVAPGPNNSVEPGGPDRGQPTFFLPRRQSWVFRVRVPRDFGTQVVTWTITVNGKTEKAYGDLMPVEEITERIVMTRGNLNPGTDDPNTPPSITIVPLSGMSAMSAADGKNSQTLTAMVRDDGLPKPRPVVNRPKPAGDATTIQAQANSSASGRPRGLTLAWMQLRGPGKVIFDPQGPTAVAEGKAMATARFPQRGIYVLRATANDGALSTTADVTVAVDQGTAGR